MLNNILISLFIFTGIGSCLGQEIPVGSWRDHLPYSDAISVTEGNGMVYCATNSTVFTYNKSDFTVERLNLVNGLSDVNPSKVKFNVHNNRVIIAYANGNIDIIDENKNIVNLSFIKNSSIVADKKINHIYLVGKLAYLSTGFGIVVVDTDRLEIVDTYLFGPLGNFVVTNAVTMDSTKIYAATEQGVFFANKTNPNLVDYNNWSLLTDLGTTNYSNIATFSNRVFVGSNSVALNGDTIYYNDSNVWQKFIPTGVSLQSLTVSNNNLLITTLGIIKTYDLALNETRNIFTANGTFFIDPKEATIDTDEIIWYADNSHGLIKSSGNWTNLLITPNGPSSSDVFDMDFKKDELWIVSGGQNLFFSQKLVNHKNKEGWVELDKTITDGFGNRAFDMVSVAINPNSPSNVFVGSWSSGLYEYNNDQITNIYNGQNSTLDSTFLGSTSCSALSFDDNNNLWVMCSFSENILNVKTTDNNWFSYSFPNFTTTLDQFQDIIIDQNNYKWIVNSQTKGIIVFNDNNTLADKSDDVSVLNTNVPGNKIKSILEDDDGEIWVGTDEGISVFYNPSNVFDENIEAERIYVQQDGQTQILFETETVNAIAIDGANRKWIGTLNSGVFLMSEDGTEEILHFNTDNSPLFSNNIFDIDIDPKTGEVFIGTEKGLLSYKGTATEADADFNNVFVYPNPVKPDFTGTIAIRGLVKDTDVRITDISGNIVYQTTSLGGQAVWDGKDFNGNKVHTGVYMIFNGSPGGELKAVAKILFIH